MTTRRGPKVVAECLRHVGWKLLPEQVHRDVLCTSEQHLGADPDEYPLILTAAAAIVNPVGR